MYIKYFILSFLFSFSISISNSQNTTSMKNNYLWFDKQVGIENTELFNGLRYDEEFRMENDNHKFYKTLEFLNGDIIYDRQPYYDIQMKYDLYEDQIIVNLITKSGNNILKLLNSKINRFTINGSEFIKLSNSSIINSNEMISGIFETLFNSTDFTLYKKNKKKAKKIITKKYLYYTFKEDNQYYGYQYKNYYLIKSKKDWIKIFPNQKKEIQTFYNKNKLLIQSDYDLFLKQLSLKLSNSIAYNTSLN